MLRISPRLPVAPRPLPLLALLLALCLPLAMSACSGRSKAEKLHAKGVILYKNAQYYKAISNFEEALKLQPGRLDTLAQCADAYLKTGKPDRALDYAQRILRAEPENTSAYLIMGQAHLVLARDKAETNEAGERRLNQAELDQAAQIAAQLRRKKVDAPEGLLLQARIDQINDKLDSAERLYRRVLEKQPENTTALIGLTEVFLAQKQYAQAEKLARKSLGDPKKPEPLALRQLALSLQFQNQYDAAYEVLAPLVGEKNETPDINHYLLAGSILMAQIKNLTVDQPTSQTPAGATPAAAAKNQPELDRAIKRLAALGSVMKGRYPSFPESFYFRAVSFQLQGNLAETIRNLQEACTKAPPEAKQFRMALALALMQGKDYAAARQELRILLKNVPGDFDAQYRLAQCYAAEGSFDDAAEILRQLQTKRPKDKMVTQTLAKVLVLSGEPKNVNEGLAILSKGAEENPLIPGGKQFIQGQAALTEAEASLAAGRVDEANAKFQQAETFFLEAGRLQPDNFTIHLKLSQLAVQRNDLLTALAQIHRAAQIDPQFLPVKAGLFTRLGQLDSARDIYEQLLKLNPNAPGYELALADLDFQLNRVGQARRRYEALITKYPDDARAYLRLAMLKGRTDGPETALQYLKDNIGRFPDDLSLQIAQAQMCLRTAKPDEAATILARVAEKMESRLSATRAQAGEQAAAIVRGDVAAVYQQLAMAELVAGQSALVKAHAEKIADLDPAEKYQASLIQAIAELQNNQPAAAESALEPIQMDPAKAPPAVALIHSLARLMAGDAKQAAAMVVNQPSLNQNTVILYQRMLSGHPAAALNDAAPALALQVYLAMNRDYAPMALNLAGEILKILPNDPFVLSRKAEALQMLDKLPESLEVYRVLQKAVPDFSPVLMAQADLHMAQADLALGQGDNAKAQEEKELAARLCGQFLEKNPNDTETLAKLATIYQISGKLDEANQLYRRSIQLNANNWSASNNLAWNLAEANQLDEAAKIAEQARAAAPQNGGVLDTLGWIEFKRGRIDRALEMLTKASLRLPNEPEVRYHLAQALQRKGRSAEAAGQLEVIILAAPYYQHINDVRGMLRRLNPQSKILIDRATGATSATLATGAKP